MTALCLHIYISVQYSTICLQHAIFSSRHQRSRRWQNINVLLIARDTCSCKTMLQYLRAYFQLRYRACDKTCKYNALRETRCVCESLPALHFLTFLSIALAVAVIGPVLHSLDEDVPCATSALRIAAQKSYFQSAPHHEGYKYQRDIVMSCLLSTTH